jgi:hypothetical protein
MSALVVIMGVHLKSGMPFLFFTVNISKNIALHYQLKYPNDNLYKA